MKNQEPETKLLEKLRAGEKEAIKTLYQDIYHSLKHFLRKKGASPEESRDLFQESLFIFYNNLQKPDFELHCTVKTYLFSVARNLWYKRANSRKRESTVDWENTYGLELIDIDDGIESKIQLEKKYNLVFTAIEQIKEDCRRLLKLFYFENQPLKDIAQVMEYTENFVKIKKKRCLKALKRLISTLEKEEEKNRKT